MFALVVLAVVLLAGVAYAIPAVVMSGKMLPGTQVQNIDIGGLTATEAADKLREQLGDKAARTMTLLAAGKKYDIDPDKSGLEFDVVATINQAPSDFPAPMEVWRALTGTLKLDPQISVDSDLLESTVTSLAKKIDVKVREGKVAFEGVKPVVVTPQDGRILEQEAAAATIRKAFLGPEAEIRLPVSVIKPKVTADVVKKAAAVAGKALPGPVTLTYAGKQAQLPVETLAAHLSFEPDDSGGMSPSFDAKNAIATVEKRLVDPSLAPSNRPSRSSAESPSWFRGTRARASTTRSSPTTWPRWSPKTAAGPSRSPSRPSSRGSPKPRRAGSASRRRSASSPRRTTAASRG
ncbi:peptidoglycan binding domain-containing protein [Streptosporangium lutulentum]